MSSFRIIAAFMGAALISSVIAVSWFSTSVAQMSSSGNNQTDTNSIDQDTTTEEHDESMTSTVVRDSVAFVGKRIVPPNDYIHLYDTTPYMIMNGHVAAKIPCDINAEPKLQILVGQAPDLKPAELEYIQELSTPGKQCLYHADLESEQGEDVEGGVITDVAIFNPSSQRVITDWTTSIVIGINEIMPIAGGSENHDEEGESTG